MSTWKLTKKLKESHLSSPFKTNNSSSNASIHSRNSAESSSHVSLPSVTAGPRRSEDIAALPRDDLPKSSSFRAGRDDTVTVANATALPAATPRHEVTSTAFSPGLLSVSISRATGVSLPPGYSWPQQFLDIGKTSIPNKYPKLSSVEGSSGTSVADRRAGGQSVSSSAADRHPRPLAATKRRPPIYIVLEFDKTQVIVDASGGTVEAPVFDSLSNFDFSRAEPLSVQVFAKVPVNPDHSNPGNSSFTPPSISADSTAGTDSKNESSSGDGDDKNKEPSAPPPRKRFQEIFLGSSKIESAVAAAGYNGSVNLSSGTGKISMSIAFTPSKTKKHLTIEDFELLKVVGKGSFGKVMQVKKIDTQRIYALKTIRKAHIVSRSEVNHTLAERTVLAQIDNPFIVPLKFSFQSPEKLYLVLAFVNGGELFHHLQREGRFDLNRARFYTAELLCALECLHQYNVIYRDLKPENILLDYTGHIALCDFGLCKLNMDNQDKTNTFCGTPEYLAPELLLGKGYTKVVDWWTLGVLFYEMLTGLPPFYDQDTNEMYRKILREPLRFPDDMDREARSLLTGLLNRDPTKRLGINGAAEIKAHPFFAQIDWKRLMNKKYAAPYKPSVESDTDTSNFDQEFTNEEPTDSVVDKDYYLSESVQQQFGGWTYVNNDSKLASSGKW